MKAAAFSSSGVPVPRPFRFLDARNFTSSRKRLGSIDAVAQYAAAAKANEHRATPSGARLKSIGFRAARVSKRCSSLFDIRLIQLRCGKAHFAAAVFARIVGGLLVVDFVVDDVAQVPPKRWPRSRSTCWPFVRRAP